MSLVTNLRELTSGWIGGRRIVIPVLAVLACSSSAYGQVGVSQQAAAPAASQAATTAPTTVPTGGATFGASLGPREVLLGTSTTPRVITPAAERDAQAYYDAAEREQHLGRVTIAQRHLELLVARYPQTSIANVARHDLIALYSRDPMTAERHAGLQPSTRSATAFSAQAASATASIDLEPMNHLGISPAPDVPVAIGSADATSADAAITSWRTSTLPGVTATGTTTGTVPAGRGKRPPRTVQDTFRQSAGDLVFFSDGSAELGARARRVLEAQAEWLKLQPTARVKIEGHADDSGSTAENVRLSEARAKAVVNRLTEAGIEPARLVTSAVGKTKRVAECDDAACAAQNRRVTSTVISPVDQAVVQSAGRFNPGELNPGRLNSGATPADATVQR